MKDMMGFPRKNVPGPTLSFRGFAELLNLLKDFVASPGESLEEESLQTKNTEPFQKYTAADSDKHLFRG